MKKIIWFLLISSSLILGTAFGSAWQNAEKLLNSAKLDVFDEKWEDALVKFKELQQEYPDQPAAIQASFWEAHCLDKIGRNAEALVQYESFLNRSDNRMPQVKQAEYSIVRLACQLYREGNRRYIDRALTATESRDKDLRLIAGVELSFISESRINRRAVPSLMEFMENSPDPEIQNQAALALLRIDPKILDERPGKSTTTSRSSGSNESKEPKSNRKFLRLSILEGGTESFRFSLPLSLARMLFSALPDEARESLEEEGINPENILQELEKAEEMLEIKSGNQVFRLWVE
jgi:tetratricopeptide (TPR) repeat protein